MKKSIFKRKKLELVKKIAGDAIRTRDINLGKVALYP